VPRTRNVRHRAPTLRNVTRSGAGSRPFIGSSTSGCVPVSSPDGVREVSARTLRVTLIGASRHAIREPFAGGLEAHVWSLARGLKRRGHHVRLFAGPGSDPTVASELLPALPVTISPTAATDVSMPSRQWVEEHHAYLGVMLRLARQGISAGDLVHNHSVHYLPVAMAPALRIPVVTTLHTPPTPWLESAVQLAQPERGRFVAVSRHTATAWDHVVPRAGVVPNGVDTSVWRPGPGGGPLVWFGRMVPEKGAHLAARAARLAGDDLVLCGPRSDPGYFDELVRPGLRGSIRYAGHLTRRELVELVGQASACLVTPRWDEPYGLVVAEALACGTPVAGFARGGTVEIVDADSGLLVPADDVEALAAAIPRAKRLSRAAARRRAETHCSLERMLDGYENLYHELAGR
jgi:glycosyltransferase involved in cell wall biosynthesis